MGELVQAGSPAFRKVLIEELHEDPANVRKHGKKNRAVVRASLKEWGQVEALVVQKGTGRVIGGNCRLAELKALGRTEVWVSEVDVQGVDATRLGLVLNRSAELAEWDDDLKQVLDGLQDGGVDIAALGWSDEDLEAITADQPEPEEEPELEPEGDDETPEVLDVADSRPGEVYLLGPHRLGCGDSTDESMVAKLLDGIGPIPLLHADPPYGMGKEADGVMNDNLYAGKLDAFQLKWWWLWSDYCAESCAAYIWGNAPELWRLWYGGLSKEDDLVVKNEIVWNKGSGFGMASKDMRSFSTATERALLIMRGPQEQNINSDNYWEGWEPLRTYLDGERLKMGWSVPDVNILTKTKMGAHWFTKSQWTFPTLENYKKIQEAAHGRAFLIDYSELRSGHEGIRKGFEQIRKEFQDSRAYFDASWEPMTDVWDFPRVHGDERHGHATPKPVAMIGRAIKSACPKGEWVAEPFGGSGTTLIAAAETGRRCATMELDPRYCDVIRRRWTSFADKNNLDAGPGALRA